MKELKFIHITKTGGTSIEDSGKIARYEWGKFHKEYNSIYTPPDFPPWHTYFPLLDNKIKEKYDWFTVVRNPYERLVSEFHYTLLPNKIYSIDKIKFNTIVRDKITNRSYVGNHWSEQYQYIDNEYVIHILKFEQLLTEFNTLMSRYNININLIHSNTQPKKFTIYDLDKDSLSLINTIYKKDFEYFNYEII